MRILASILLWALAVLFPLYAISYEWEQRQAEREAAAIAGAARVQDCVARVDFFVAGGGLDPDDRAAALTACLICKPDSKDSSCNYWLDQIK
jgi:hypothetical protein